MDLHGQHLIGDERSRQRSGDPFHATDPVLGKDLQPSYVDATTDEVHQAFVAADEAHRALKEIDRQRRADLLDRIASGIEDLGDSLIERTGRETGLPEARLKGERGRTCGQLRMFAELLRQGWYQEPRIDHAEPDRKPIPKPDVRQILRPLGPVAIFGASNFPLAFSVAGGDTASALAAGCPVVVKAHPNHPGCSEMVGRAIAGAVAELDFPAGTFSLLHGAGHEVGLAMVRHPLAKAVGFTGSFGGGKALFDAAMARDEPIPVFAEMGSTNPVFIMPGAARERGDEIAAGLRQSVTLGVGQFCTNPGLVFTLDDEQGRSFRAAAAEALAEAEDDTMLHAGIRGGYESGLSRLSAVEGVERHGRPLTDAEAGQAPATPALFSTDAATFADNPQLAEEVFGPSTVLIACASVEEMQRIAEGLQGQLSATIHGTDEDLAEATDLVATLEDKAGRLVVNAFPTGVEVCHSMHHGGPFPATTDSRTTSVGSLAIRRFLRPVCYQDFPEHLLPEDLRDDNPRGVLRLVDGEWTRD